MRLGNYMLERGPSRGWEGVSREPRITVSPTLDGVVATILQGHVGDEMVTLPFDLLDAAPAKTVVRTYGATDVVAETITPGQAAAYMIPVAPGGFAAISAARIRLKQVGMVGELRVEVWDTAAGVPNERVGQLGVLRAADIGAAFTDLDVFTDCAWPIGSPEGWLVLNGTLLTAGTIDWAGEVVTPNAHAKKTVAWALANGELSGTVWQGGQCLVLRGLVGAYGMRGQSLEADLDDGQLYDAQLVGLSAQRFLTPTMLEDHALASNVRLTLALTGEH